MRSDRPRTQEGTARCNSRDCDDDDANSECWRLLAAQRDRNARLERIVRAFDSLTESLEGVDRAQRTSYDMLSGSRDALAVRTRASERQIEILEEAKTLLQRSIAAKERTANALEAEQNRLLAENETLCSTNESLRSTCADLRRVVAGLSGEGRPQADRRPASGAEVGEGEWGVVSTEEATVGSE